MNQPMPSSCPASLRIGIISFANRLTLFDMPYGLRPFAVRREVKVQPGFESQPALRLFFAPEDRSDEYFCGSVDMREEKRKQRGGKMPADGLKVDGDPADALGEILVWAESIVAQFSSKLTTGPAERAQSLEGKLDTIARP